jgi:hypothetical protein
MHNDRMDQVGFICVLCAKALGGRRKPTRSLAFSIPLLISCAALGTIQVCPRTSASRDESISYSIIYTRHV